MSEQDPTVACTRHARNAARTHRPGSTAGSHVSVLLNGEDTGGRFALLELLEVRGDEPPRHLHHWEDETLYVLKGEITVSLGDMSIPAPVGTAIVLPRGVEHSYSVVSDTASLLALYTPSGFEDYFHELAESATGTPASIERLIGVAARHGCEITGPPPGGTSRSPPG
jgi:quercetin dioxygenase-like cupin family protein